MGRREIERQLRVKCLELEYDVLKIKEVPGANSIFALLFDGTDARELYVNPDIRYADLQTLSAVCIHEPYNVSHWFDFE